MTVPRVKYIGPFAQRTGYAQAGHDYLLAMDKAGIALNIVPIHDADSDHLDERYKGLLKYTEEDAAWIAGPTHVLVHTIPRFAHEFVTTDLDLGSSVKKVCITTWETDSFPDEDAKNLNMHFDLIIVPSSFNAMALHKAGIPNHKIRVVPHTFHPHFWQQDPGIEAQPRKSPYVFYSILSWNDRKNPIGLLKAYFAAFRKWDDVLLRIVSPVVNEDDVKHLAQCMGIPGLPRVEFLGVLPDRLPETALRDVHRRSHCYVTVTRGEGWGLGAFEACLVGNPVIATAFSGHMDFLKEYTGRVVYVPCQLTPAVTPEIKVGNIEIGDIKIPAMAPGAPTGISGDQNWAEPDLVAAGRIMRAMYAARESRMQRPVNRTWSTQYSYETIGPQLRQILEDM